MKFLEFLYHLRKCSNQFTNTCTCICVVYKICIQLWLLAVFASPLSFTELRYFLNIKLHQGSGKWCPAKEHNTTALVRVWNWPWDLTEYVALTIIPLHLTRVISHHFVTFPQQYTSTHSHTKSNGKIMIHLYFEKPSKPPLGQVMLRISLSKLNFCLSWTIWQRFWRTLRTQHNTRVMHKLWPGVWAWTLRHHVSQL